MKPRKATSSVIAGIRAKTRTATPEVGDLPGHLAELRPGSPREAGKSRSTSKAQLADERVERQGQAGGQGEVAGPGQPEPERPGRVGA